MFHLASQAPPAVPPSPVCKSKPIPHATAFDTQGGDTPSGDLRTSVLALPQWSNQSSPIVDNIHFYYSISSFTSSLYLRDEHVMEMMKPPFLL